MIVALLVMTTTSYAIEKPKNEKKVEDVFGSAPLNIKLETCYLSSMKEKDNWVRYQSVTGEWGWTSPYCVPRGQ